MTPQPGPMPEEARRLLRHTVATLAYRAEKALRDVPDGFAELRLSPATRTPLETVAHLGDLMAWGERLAQGTYRWAPVAAANWSEAVDRFFMALAAFDAALAAAPELTYTAEVIFQGPIADALTHVGQLSMMRGTMAAPVRPEAYARAAITIGRVGREQSAERTEFSGDASRPGDR